MTGEARRRSLCLRKVLPPSPIEVLLRSRLTLDFHGADELPDQTGPTMIVANFASPADPALVLSALPDRWRRHTAVTLPEDTPRWWRPPRRTVLLRRTLRTAVHPTAGEKIAELLEEGRSVLCFPEGQRSQDGFLAPFRVEIASVAVDRGVPVLPVGLRGSYAAIPGDARWPVSGRPRVSVRLGTPRRPEAGESAAGFASRLQDEVRHLIEEDASSWWVTQRNADRLAVAPPTASWRRIWEQTQVPTAGGRPRRPKIWRS